MGKQKINGTREKNVLVKYITIDYEKEYIYNIEREKRQ